MKMWKASVAVALVALVGLASGQTWLSNITDHFREGTSNVMRMSEVNYSKPIINVTYMARVEVDMRAMGHLYNSTYTIIDFIANKQAYPEGIVSVSDGHVELASPRSEWRSLLAHYAGPLAVAVLVILFAAVLPLSGLFWCCCQWCRVGRRRRPFDRKYDACLKGILAIVFIGLLTLFLFGVVCAFVTDSQMETGASAAPNVVRAAVRDARTFLDASAGHARHLLVDNFRELETQLDRSLAAGGAVVLRQLDEFTNATSVRRLELVASTLERVPDELRRVQAATAALRAGADSLDEGLRRVKASLFNTLARCQEPQCVTLQEKYKIGQLYTDIQYDKIPDVSELLDNVSRLVDGDMVRDVRAGLQVFTGIRRTVDQHAPRVREAVAATGERLARVADEVSWAAGNLSERLRTSHAPDVLQEHLRQYGPYVRHPTRAVAAALLAIVVVMSWGLVCGVCGKRPDVYGASDCCNKGSGASCITCGMALTFAVGGVAAVAMLVYFIFGIAAQRLVCDPLSEPRGSRVFVDVERFVELERSLYNERSDPDFNLTSVLVDCHANRTIYHTLRLRRAFDLESVRDRVSSDVSSRVSSLRTDYPPRGRPLRILAPAARARLDRLAASGLSDFDFDRILGALETNVTSLSLEALATQLRSTSRALQSRPGFRTVAGELTAAADDVSSLHRDVVGPMLERTKELNKTASELRDALRFNESSLREAILSCVRDTNEVELFLNTQGPDLVQNLTREFAETLGERLQQYLSMVARAAERDVGRCGPLSNAFNATRDAACRAFVLPANGYWVSVCWCALLMPVVLCVSARLARLYRRAEPYPGPLVEAEYLYDAYTDRDNVPLANAYKEKRGGGGTGSGPGGLGGSQGGGAARRRTEGPEGAGASHALAPPVDTHHARRYNDMAPKHWEEGPPRYHGPTEYERPPPYYYPGPNDRQ
ncbi:prominin-like protein isoform X2 [Danaus plexippus]|uniref:prominin-like protein isoform X2 n=1 Tax=Danaus plexippus TaxID=13037 RepID=UPI002AB1AB2E|nr:prominin-like protein isoform X2 [Danaus plexippus]